MQHRIFGFAIFAVVVLASDRKVTRSTKSAQLKPEDFPSESAQAQSFATLDHEGPKPKPIPVKGCPSRDDLPLPDYTPSDWTKTDSAFLRHDGTCKGKLIVVAVRLVKKKHEAMLRELADELSNVNAAENFQYSIKDLKKSDTGYGGYGGDGVDIVEYKSVETYSNRSRFIEHQVSQAIGKWGFFNWGVGKEYLETCPYSCGSGCFTYRSTEKLCMREQRFMLKRKRRK
jgi:hypothetical protein